MNQRNWPKDYSPEEIRDILAEGDLSKAGGFESWKEAGLAELLIRTKKSAEEFNKKNFRITIAILIISILGLLASIILGIIQ